MTSVSSVAEWPCYSISIAVSCQHVRGYNEVPVATACRCNRKPEATGTWLLACRPSAGLKRRPETQTVSRPETQAPRDGRASGTHV